MNSYIPIRPTLPTFGNGSTSHTQIHISMVLLNLLPSEAAKAETKYARRTGTSFGSILPCSKTPYLPSTFLHIRFTLIEELMWCITIRPSQTFFVSMHHKRLSRNKTLATLDKRSRALVLFKTPIIVLFFIKKNTIKLPSGTNHLVKPRNCFTSMLGFLWCWWLHSLVFSRQQQCLRQLFLGRLRDWVPICWLVIQDLVRHHLPSA